MQPIEKNLRPRRCEREANEYAALLWMAAGGKKKNKKNSKKNFHWVISD